MRKNIRIQSGIRIYSFFPIIIKKIFFIHSEKKRKNFFLGMPGTAHSRNGTRLHAPEDRRQNVRNLHGKHYGEESALRNPQRLSALLLPRLHPPVEVP